jgi:hypothetical protein
MRMGGSKKMFEGIGMKHLLKVIPLFVALSLVSTFPAAALTIDFEDLTGPSLFALASPSPQVVNYTNVGGSGIDVTFTGGVILDTTANLPANDTSVYGTAYFGTNLTNPLTITFSQGISNFYMDLYNGLSTNIDYRVSDNDGHSADFTLVPNLSSGQTLVGFAATGTVITVASITAPTDYWDFFIDNIHFNEALPPDLNPVPEPGTMLMLGSGLVGLAGWGRKKFRK